MAETEESKAMEKLEKLFQQRSDIVKEVEQLRQNLLTIEREIERRARRIAKIDQRIFSIEPKYTREIIYEAMKHRERKRLHNSGQSPLPAEEDQ